jgi:hypothetical protein
MDETSVNAKRRFKIVTAPDPEHVNHALPITVQISKFPHLTGCTMTGKRCSVQNKVLLYAKLWVNSVKYTNICVLQFQYL